MEIWKSAKDYEDIYQVSNLGRVRRINNKKRGVAGKALAPKSMGKGYWGVTLHRDGTRKNYYLHQLVAWAFLGDPPTVRHEVNHIDRDKRNNAAANLEYVTHRRNMEHSQKDHTKACRDGNQAKLTMNNARLIREFYASGVYTQAALADLFGISVASVNHVLTEKTWKEG